MRGDRHTRRVDGAIALCCALAVAGGAHASVTRYALVVGNNAGHTDALELERLRHAERDAARLRGALLEHGLFDAARIELVAGQGRASILAAAAKLAQQRARDRRELGEQATLFAFFFTGHGLGGTLLTADDPLSGEDLARIFESMDAALSIGFFDACHAGGLDIEALRSKGATLLPGFNPAAGLPEELLSAEGTVWFSSSRASEMSYEDEVLGGLFTHYFVEAFTAVKPDRVGVTLEDMWQHAQRRTAQHAARHGRRQTPEKIVRRLRARGPLYFSFPRERDAVLRFAADVDGEFLLYYEEGVLVERVVKRAGEPLEVATFSGQLLLSRGGARPESGPPARTFTLAAGEVVNVAPDGVALPADLGFHQASVRGKGTLAGLHLTRRSPAPTLLVGLGYRYLWVEESMLGAPHGLAGALRLRYGGLGIGLDLAYGPRFVDVGGWGYTLHELALRTWGGYSWDLHGVRLGPAVGVGPLLEVVSYSDTGRTDTPVGVWFGAGFGVEVPLPLRSPWVVLSLRGELGGRVGRGVAGQDRELHLSLEPGASAGLSIPLQLGG